MIASTFFIHSSAFLNWVKVIFSFSNSLLEMFAGFSALLSSRKSPK